MVNSIWTAEEGGKESNSSPQIINQALAWLKKRRAMLTLLHRGYQSSGTVLVQYNENQLEIGKPPDWPNSDAHIRVLFKDSGKLWNYFTVNVQAANADLLLTRRPTTLYRLQRRAHYRVETPSGTFATFLHKGKASAKIDVHDICAGGMQLRSREKLALSGDDLITNICISLPGAHQLLQIAEDQSPIIKIRQGRVTRLSEEQSLFCWGIIFQCSRNEEEILLRYVRQRELELLRKGLQKE